MRKEELKRVVLQRMMMEDVRSSARAMIEMLG